MRKSKLVLLVSALALTAFVGVVWATSQAQDSADLAGHIAVVKALESEACAQDLSTSLFGPTLEDTLSEGALQPTAVACPSPFCTTDAQCRSACPQAATARCNGLFCVYTSAGGGGGGSHDPPCAACSSPPFCLDNTDCLGICPTANSATCENSICVFRC